MKYTNFLFLFVLFFTTQANAAITLDRTRIVFPGDKNSVVLTIENTNEKSSYLAQSWLEDAKENKISDGPFVALPPLQSLAPKAKSVVQINKTGLVKNLPADRETLLYYNLREIPPKTDDVNVLQIALQSNVKLFYRPDAILSKSKSEYQRDVTFSENTKGYVIKNPTPFYITVIGMGKTEDESLNSDFNVTMVAPFSEAEVITKKYKDFYMSYINDFGGRKTIKFICNGAQCSSSKN